MSKARTAVTDALAEQGRLRAQQRATVVKLARRGLKAGMTKQEIADLAGISRPTLNTWLKP